MLELVSAEVGYDVKKKHAPPRSNIFGNTDSSILIR
jgi:hypothetical protein